MDIMNTITTLLNNNLDIEPEQVTEDATFDSLGIDSLTWLNSSAIWKTNAASSSASPKTWKP